MLPGWMPQLLGNVLLHQFCYLWERLVFADKHKQQSACFLGETLAGFPDHGAYAVLLLVRTLHRLRAPLYILCTTWALLTVQCEVPLLTCADFRAIACAVLRRVGCDCNDWKCAAAATED